jgi:hypothetical protein
MARPCDCRACAASPYVRLVHSAQADQDAAHRQQAIDAIALIAPSAGSIGADGSCPGDHAAAPILARLYPQPAPGPDPRAAIEAGALDEFRKLAALSQGNG